MGENLSSQEVIDFINFTPRPTSTTSFNNTTNNLMDKISDELEQDVSKEQESTNKNSNIALKTNQRFSSEIDKSSKQDLDRMGKNNYDNATQLLKDTLNKCNNQSLRLHDGSGGAEIHLKQNSRQFNDKKKEEKGSFHNKKKSWYSQILSPTYKSRSDTFKKLFKNIPDEERLLIDYSCALQQDSTIHGRLYVSQNYFCFYANIIKRETICIVPWKDVSAITKERTALVIPNAIVIQTDSDKFFFSSFSSRDKTYMLLLKLWQNSLTGQNMDVNEVYQIVHDRYGKELGLTSDDEDLLLSSIPNEDKLSKHLSLDSVAESENKFKSSIQSKIFEESLLTEFTPMNRPFTGRENSQNESNITDSNDSEEEKKQAVSVYSQTRLAVCSAPHDGRLLMKVNLPIHIDQLFTLLFTTSKFFLDFHTARKTTDLSQTAWTLNPKTGQQSRKVSFTVYVNKTVGPKTSQVSETQVMLPCSIPGHLYSINVESVNAGIPYADSFNIFTHYCMRSNSLTESTLEVFAEIKYKKSVWGLVKSFIEKNCWSGMQEYLNSLIKALATECDGVESITQDFHKKNKRRISVTPLATQSSNTKADNRKFNSRNHFIADIQGDKNIILSWLLLGAILCLILINCVLYFKLQRIEEAASPAVMDLHILKSSPKTEEDWINLLQQQESLHNVETKKWQRVLHTCIESFKQTQEALTQLQTSIHPTITEKIFSVLKPGLKDHNSNNQHGSEL